MLQFTKNTIRHHVLSELPGGKGYEEYVSTLARELDMSSFPSARKLSVPYSARLAISMSELIVVQACATYLGCPMSHVTSLTVWSKFGVGSSPM